MLLPLHTARAIVALGMIAGYSARYAPSPAPTAKLS